MAPSGLEPECPRGRRILSRSSTDVTEHERAITAQADTGSDMGARECPPHGARMVSECDPVELALATALERASVAGAWASVEILGRELSARREARASELNLSPRRGDR